MKLLLIFYITLPSVAELADVFDARALPDADGHSPVLGALVLQDGGLRGIWTPSENEVKMKTIHYTKKKMRSYVRFVLAHCFFFQMSASCSDMTVVLQPT